MQEHRINREALKVLPAIAKRWLPGGTMSRGRWIARNPRSGTIPATQIKVNLVTGQWDDYDQGIHRHGAVSLAAYLFDLTEKKAAQKLADMLELR